MDMGKEMDLSGEELKQFVAESLEQELTRQEKENLAKEKEREHELARQEKENVEKEKEREEKEKEREEREKERAEEREERELRRLEINVEMEKLRQPRENGTPRSETYSQDTNSHSTVDPGMTFPLQDFNPKSDDLLQYLTRFETLAKVHNLQEGKMALKLSLHLKGTPYDIYTKLPEGSKDNYEVIKDR